MPETGPLEELVRRAQAAGASDIHVTVEFPPVFRLGGELVRADDIPLSRAQVEAILHPLLGSAQRARLEECGHVDLSYSLPGVGRFRVNVYRQRGSLAAALRLIPVRVPHLHELGLPEVVASFARLQNGLVLVTGTAGSGKSTTLAAMVNLINSERSCHVITLEDPIEYLHRHNRSVINQREIGIDSDSFAGALRAALRQDPDVIMVGEMRDLETIAIALTAAETGHLVLSSLHTIDAAQTVDRIIDVFSPHQQQQVRVQLAGVLRGIVAQALVPSVVPGRRVVACEVLVATPAVRNLIREGKTHQIVSAIQTGARFGMCTMEASLRRLAETGQISEEQYRERAGGGWGATGLGG